MPRRNRQSKSSPGTQDLPDLVDGQGRRHTYLRVSVTDRCNLRCVYCMPPEGICRKPREEILRFDELLRLVRLLARMGIRKVRLTGGEPLVRRDIEQLVAEIAATPGIETVGLTTNGVLLGRLAAALRAAGLTRLNVSLDTLRPERFQRIALRDNYADVRAGIEAALQAGFAPLRLNVVVMGGINDDEICDFVRLTAGQPLDVRFIEYMPFQANRWHEAAFVPYRVMLQRIMREFPLACCDDDPQATTAGKHFRVPGFVGSIGFITSMSDHFCGSCNRLRLLADGGLKACLFDPHPVNLRPPLRSGASDAELESLIRRAVAGKAPQHPVTQDLVHLDNQSMIQIGG